MDDTISRQAALDAILKKPAWHNSDGSYYHSSDIKDALEAMPSVQPFTEEEVQKMADLEQAEIEKAFELGRQDAMSEIIHCEDCKWWAHEEEGTNKRCNAAKLGHMSRHWDIYICRTYPADFYCADADRRTDD